MSARLIDDATGDTIPPANDPLYIQAIHKKCHLQLTTGRKSDAARTVTTAGSDIHVAAKIKRMNAPKKAKQKIQSRGFAKSKRKLQSRGFSK